MQRGPPSFSGAEARSLVHDDSNGVSEGVWVHNAIPRRHSNHAQQHSRSNSTTSQSTLKARPQRASWQEPKTTNPWNPMGDADAPPVPALKRVSKGDGTGTPINFSRRTSVHRENSSHAQKNLTENEVPPPVPSNPNGGDLAAAERQANRQSDPERNIMRSPDSGPPFAARRTEDYLHKTALPSRPSDWLTTLYTISHLIFFSIFGTLARLGVQWFSFYPGTPIVTPVLWANVGGSFVMGFLTEDRQLFRDEWMARERLHPDNKSTKEGHEPGELSASERNKIKKTVPLYVGLAVGFCGSFTSFSSSSARATRSARATFCLSPPPALPMPAWPPRSSRPCAARF